MSEFFCRSCGFKGARYPYPMCPVCGIPVATKSKPAKRWSCASALQYAHDHANGANVDAVGLERSNAGNPEGAARLCAWALARKVKGEGGRDRNVRRQLAERALSRVIAKAFRGACYP